MSSAASRMSAATANSAPPPSAWAFRAAVVGGGNPAIRSQIARIRNASDDASSSVRSALSSLRSPPETNARSPAPVMTSAAAPSAPSSAFSSWSIVSSEMALRACGRSMVTIARPSANSRPTITRSPSAVLAFSVSENSIASGLWRCRQRMRNIPVELTKRYVAEGWWTQDTLGDLIARGLQASPGAGFHVHSDVRPFAGTFHDVEIEARRLAAGLRARGVGPGDVVALQLPNWMEAAAAFWASAFLGAVTVPIVHFYGRKELGHILGTAKPRVFITAEEFGRMQFQPALCADIPIVGLVGKDYEDLLDTEPLEGTLAADPASPWFSRHASCWRTPRPSEAANSPAPRWVTSSACWPPSSFRYSRAHPSICATSGTRRRCSSSSSATGSRSAADRPTSSPACWTIPIAPQNICVTSRPLALAARQ